MSLGQIVFFDLPDGDMGGVDRAEFEAKMPSKFRLVHPMCLGEAFLHSQSRKEPIRIESFGADYAMMWLRKSSEVHGVHIVTYDGRTKYEINRISYPQGSLSSDQSAFASDFEVRVDKILGRMTWSKLSQNSINVILQRCAAIRLRKDGRVYFVPSGQYSSTLDEYAQHAQSLGIYTFRVDAEKTGRSIESVTKSVEEDVTERMMFVLGQASKNSTVRGYGARAAEIAELLKLVRLYKLMLGVKLEDTESVLNEAEEMIRQLTEGASK